MSMTVKKGDTVVVIAGKDKGKKGKVLEVFPKDNRVIVDGVNIVSKHKKARTQQEQSAIIKKTAPIDASNVMVVCGVCGKATRVAHREIDGKKARVCKKCSASLDKEYVKQTKKEAKKTVKADAKSESVKETKATAKASATKTTAKPAKSATAKTSTTKSTAAKSTKTSESEVKTEKKTSTKSAKTSGTKSTTQKSNAKKTEG